MARNYFSALARDIERQRRQAAREEERIKKLNQKLALQRQKEQIREQKENAKQAAVNWTKEAQNAISYLEGFLLYSLKKVCKFNWDTLKISAVFEQPEPVTPRISTPYSEPKPDEKRFAPSIGLVEFLSSKKKKLSIERALEYYSKEHQAWEKQRDKCEADNRVLMDQYETDRATWLSQKREFESSAKQHNDDIDRLKGAISEGDPEAIETYTEGIIDCIEYPEEFPREFELEYNGLNKVLIISYELPSPELLPNVKEVKYVQTSNEYKFVKISRSESEKLYDSFIYQLCLLIIRKVFESDLYGSIEAIAFNGWVQSVDKATGKQISACIISVMAKKEEFMQLSLENVDAKICFKSLKGVGSSKLFSITPIPPVLDLNRNDRRFVNSYEVASILSDSYNIATMDWEDFEHLIRQVFEEEFKSTGGEVKITRASRDAGVDAVAFDPDPIRGGKIVIQAKRYTNTVGVSAVRDLYGTLLNEGANKGILVSTSDYGPDAYEFAKGKPITLLSGANLLSLLEKHGYKARINLLEAKQVLKDSSEP